MSKVRLDGALTVEDTPDGLLFSAVEGTLSPFTGVLDTGWFIDVPPGIRAKVVEIIGNIAVGLRVQGPVLTYRPLLPNHLHVHVDSDVPLKPQQPLFLLHFEEDLRPYVNRVD